MLCKRFGHFLGVKFTSTIKKIQKQNTKIWTGVSPYLYIAFCSKFYNSKKYMVQTVRCMRWKWSNVSWWHLFRWWRWVLGRQPQAAWHRSRSLSCSARRRGYTSGFPSSEPNTHTHTHTHTYTYTQASKQDTNLFYFYLFFFEIKKPKKKKVRVGEGRNAYACMLGGPDGNTLYICTASSSNGKIARESRGGRIETVQGKNRINHYHLVINM